MENQKFFEDKFTTLVTGASGYLGKCICESFAKKGSNLILVDINKNKLEEMQINLKNMFKTSVFSYCCNLEVDEERENLLSSICSEHDHLNCLINNAAFVGTSEITGWNTSFENQSLESWKRAMEVNLTAPFHLSKLLTPLLRKSNYSSIINISSIYGIYAPDWNLYQGTKIFNPAAYSVSKAGLIQLTKWLATTLSPDIRVNAIAPGGIFRKQDEIFVKKYIHKTPLKRMAKENDIVEPIVFLASKMSNYITGEVIIIDGGYGLA
mgnify:CR=1 FL=1